VNSVNKIEKTCGYLIKIFSKNLGEPRTIEQQIEILQSAAGYHLGYANMPLTDIPFTAYLMDILFQFLRVSDLLVDLLLDELFRLDQMYASSKYSPSTHTNTSVLSNFLETECRLPPLNLGYITKEVRGQMKTLQGPKKKVFFDKICNKGLKNIFRKINKKFEVTRVWDQYWFIHKKLRSDNTTKYNFLINYSSHFFENSCTHLLNLFVNCYGKQQMTPYLHVTCIHLHEMHKSHGNLNYFSNEGLEKLNDLSTFSFFRSTNKRSTFIKQMLERDARLENTLFD